MTNSLQSWRQWPRRVLMGAVRAYRLLLSPWLGSQCRFEPTCSVYSLEALERHGALHGSYLTLRRIGRCQPWCTGGCDPVPSVWPPVGSNKRSATDHHFSLPDQKPSA